MANAEELRYEIGRMVADVMLVAPAKDRPVGLASDPKDFDRLAAFSLSEMALRRLAEGHLTGAQLALDLESQGVPMVQIFYTLSRLLDHGLLDDEPEQDEQGIHG